MNRFQRTVMVSVLRGLILAKTAASASLLLLLFFDTYASANPQWDADREFSVDAMLDEWTHRRNVLDMIGGYECNLDIDDFGDAGGNRAQVQIDGKYALKTIVDVTVKKGKKERKEVPYRCLANPDYVATISMRPDGKWFLESLILRDDPTFPTTFREIFSDGRFSSITPVFIESLRSCSARSIKQKSKEGARIVEVSFENVSDFYTECVVEASESHSFLPSSIVFRGKDGLVRKHEFGNWIEYEGVTVWRDAVFSMTRVGKPDLIYRSSWTPDVLNRSPKIEDCYLSKYGLPEPDLPTNTRLYVFISVLGLLLIVTIVMIRNRR